MPIHSDWGKLYLIIFLIKEEIQSTYLLEEISKIEGELLICETAELLLTRLRSLDTAERKTIKFFAHGNPNCPGTLINSRSKGAMYVDILPTLNQMVNADEINLDFMSVCYQNDIPITGFRNWTTTTEESISLQGLIKSVAVYAQPDSAETRTLVERSNLYRLYP